MWSATKRPGLTVTVTPRSFASLRMTVARRPDQNIVLHICTCTTRPKLIPCSLTPDT